MLRKAYYNIIPWSQFYDWAKELCGGSIATFSSVKVMVGRLEKKRAELPQNKKHNELKQFLFQPLNIVQHGYTSSEETGASEVEKAAHENDKAKAEKLTSNLSRLSAHSINKHIKCWDKKIAEVQSHIKRLKSDMKSQTKTINKLESKLKMAHSSMHSLHQKLHRSNEAASDASKESNARLDSFKCQFSV